MLQRFEASQGPGSRRSRAAGIEIFSNSNPATKLVGCHLQVARNWVVGAAGLAQQGHADLAANAVVRANVLATATGRIGYAINFDSIAGLFYLKGGAAFVDYDKNNITGNASATTCASDERLSGLQSSNECPV